MSCACLHPAAGEGVCNQRLEFSALPFLCSSSPATKTAAGLTLCQLRQPNRTKTLQSHNYPRGRKLCPFSPRNEVANAALAQSPFHHQRSGACKQPTACCGDYKPYG